MTAPPSVVMMKLFIWPPSTLASIWMEFFM
jgi:hypothetical protein